jgi:hypothetical protein
MYKDFIVKQTSDFDSQFRARTLVGNWYEERCNPQKVENFHFYKERKEGDVSKQPTLTQVPLLTYRIVSSSRRATGSTSKITIPAKPSKLNISTPHITPEITI